MERAVAVLEPLRWFMLAVLCVCAGLVIPLWGGVHVDPESYVPRGGSADHAHRILREQYGSNPFARIVVVGTARKNVGIKIHGRIEQDIDVVRRSVPDPRLVRSEALQPWLTYFALDTSQDSTVIEQRWKQIQRAGEATALTSVVASPAIIARDHSRSVRSQLKVTLGVLVLIACSVLILFGGVLGGAIAGAGATLSMLIATTVMLVIGEIPAGIPAGTSLAVVVAMLTALLVSCVLGAVGVRTGGVSGSDTEPVMRACGVAFTMSICVLPLLLIPVPIVQAIVVAVFVSMVVSVFVTLAFTIMWLPIPTHDGRMEAVLSQVFATIIGAGGSLVLGAIVCAVIAMHLTELRNMRLHVDSYGIVADREHQSETLDVTQAGIVGELTPLHMVLVGGGGIATPAQTPMGPDCEVVKCPPMTKAELEASKKPPKPRAEAVRNAATKRLAKNMSDELEVRSMSAGGTLDTSRAQGQYDHSELTLSSLEAIGISGPKFVRKFRTQMVPEVRYPSRIRVYLGGWPAVQAEVVDVVKKRVYAVFIALAAALVAIGILVTRSIRATGIGSIAVVLGGILGLGVFGWQWLNWLRVVDPALRGPLLEPIALASYGAVLVVLGACMIVAIDARGRREDTGQPLIVLGAIGVPVGLVLHSVNDTAIQHVAVLVGAAIPISCLVIALPVNLVVSLLSGRSSTAP